MKIYFAGSIRGGRDDEELYLELIDYLRGFGMVLTEHVGEKEILEKERNLSDDQIYKKDMNWLKECDTVVAEVTTPSLGVGYEIGSAEALGKKILCLFREGAGRRLSAMISGNKNLIARTYKNTAQAKKAINDFFKGI